jgi:sulfatase maturation enzyme AslB (radical SAM superfamily)
MNIPHEKFCVLPWISLEASPVGTVRPCCLADDEIVDNLGKKFDLRSADLEDVQNSNHMRSLRQEFLQGKQPATCRKCWNEERSGRTSKRMHTLDRLKHMLTNNEWKVDAKPLMFLDLKLGNICNLKCRICGSWSSSQSAAEEIKWTPREQQKQTFAYQMLQAGNWPRQSEHFWQQIDQHVNNICYIEFTGGEPFLIQEHFDMLQGIVDRGIAGNVEIHYNTNGTQYPEHAPAIWQHFKTVEIAVSIDDVGERFEYQRSNAVWLDVLKNVVRFKQLRTQMSNIQLQCCITVNVFNVRYLRHVADWADYQGFDFLYWNMLHDAPHWSIASLPNNVKQAVTAYLNNCNPPEKFQIEFARIRDFMNNGASTDGAELCRAIRDLDTKRGQSFKKIFPEMASLLEI